MNINYQKIKSKYLDEIKEWFNGHYLSSYEIIYKNENYFSNFFNVNTFKFTNSGTSALYLILFYIQNKILKKKLKVLGPAFGHPSWLNVCRWLNLEFDFIDVKKETLSLNPDLLEERIQDFDVVIFIDKAGYCNEDLYKTKEICKQYNKILIEDSANAFGQKWKDYAGTIGDFAFYSFSNPKLLTSGEGGAIVSKEYNLNEELENYIYQGGWYKSGRQEFKDIGLNFSMNVWITQLLKYQLDDLEILQKEKHNLYLKHKKQWKNKLFDFESSNKFYSPSFYTIYVEDEKIKLFLKMKTFDYQLYRNLAKFFTPYNEKLYQVSEDLEKHLFYLENK